MMKKIFVLLAILFCFATYSQEQTFDMITLRNQATAPASGINGSFYVSSVDGGIYRKFGVSWDRLALLSDVPNNDFVTGGSVASENLTLTIPNQTNPVIDLSAFALDTDVFDGTWASLTGIPADIADGDDDTDAQTATQVPFTPDGSIGATNVQDAIVEVRDEAGGGGSDGLGAARDVGPFTVVDADNATIDTDAITSAHILNGTIAAADIASSTITSTQIAAATITASKLVSSTITATQIANATITGAKIAGATITGANLVNGTITATQIAAGTITSTQMAANSVGSTQIQSQAVTSGKIASFGVENSNIASDAINQEKMQDNSIGTNEIINDAIIGTKILNGTITTLDIASSTIQTGNIAPGQVQNGNLGTDAVTQVKIADDAVGTAEIIDNAITALKLQKTNSTLGAGEDGYIPTFDNATKGVTWIPQPSGGSVEDAVFGPGWDGDTTNAPSQNSVYDEMIKKVYNTISGRTGTAVDAIMIQTEAQIATDGDPDTDEIVFCSDCAPMELDDNTTVTADGYLGFDDRSSDTGTYTFSGLTEGSVVVIEMDRASAPSLSGITPSNSGWADDFVADTEQTFTLVVLPSGRGFIKLQTIE